MGPGGRRLLSAAALLLGAGAVPGIGGECPPGLREAAEAYRQVLQAREDEVRDSGPAAPRGVEETAQFDVATHACHRGPGQAYRVFGEGRCAPNAGGAATVGYTFALHFRRALTLDALFRKPWEEGDGGVLEVEFEREGNRWVPVARAEAAPAGARAARERPAPRP